MKGPVLFLLAVAAVVVFAGCATPHGSVVAIDAAQRAVAADEAIIAVYHAAVMDSLGEARAARVAEAKREVRRLSDDDMLAPEIVQDVLDVLVSDLEETDARRLTFRDLFWLARRNGEQAKEALSLADSLVARSLATHQELRYVLTETVAGLQHGTAQPRLRKEGDR